MYIKLLNPMTKRNYEKELQIPSSFWVDPLLAILVGRNIHGSRKFIEESATILAVVPYSLRRLFTLRPLSQLKVPDDAVLH